MTQYINRCTSLHALVVLPRSPYGNRPCGMCGRNPEREVHHCAACEWDVCASCAMILPTLVHPSHQHTLILQPTELFQTHECDACRSPLSTSGMAYVCSLGPSCDFQLHPQCAKVPTDLRHWAHEHPLAVHRKGLPDKSSCNFCLGEIGKGEWVHRCEKCDFNLSLPCALIPPSPSSPCHQHRLKVCKRPLSGKWWCNVCKIDIANSNTGFLYHCEPCNVLIHPSCLKSPGSTSAPPVTPAGALPDIAIAQQMHNMRQEMAQAQALARMMAESGAAVARLAPDDRYRYEYRYM